MPSQSGPRCSTALGAWALRLFAWLGLFLATPAITPAADWPAYRHDAARSGATGQTLEFPLQLAWTHTSAQPPRPAWPKPYHILNRLDFDYAPHPITGGGLVYFGSTADDTVRALDAKTGEQRWAFVTGGPVRFAPQFAENRLFFGSDDGYVYCLEALTGKLRWKFRAAPYDDMFIGNGRMISRWPVRTGVLVMDNTVYFAGGMWSADGIHVCALNADTGGVVWRNDNTGYTGVFFKGTTQERVTPLASLPKNTTHEGEFGATGITPQGALLAAGDVLLMPTGISFPARFDRRSGLYRPWDAQFSAAPGVGGIVGGSWACIDRGCVYSLAKYRQDVLGLFSTSIGDPSGEKRLGVRAVLPQIDHRASGPKDYIHDKGKASIIVHQGKVYSRNAYSLALAGRTLLLGLDGAVVAQDADTERELWRAPVDGVARELVIADDRLFVGTESGAIHCFAGGGAAPSARHAPEAGAVFRVDADPWPSSLLFAIEGVSAATEPGFALVLGDPKGEASLALARGTKLTIINALADEPGVATLRNQLLATTALYGSRIHVLPVGSLNQLPFARYFANLVFIASPITGLSGKELYRVLRPYGGTLVAPGLTREQAAALVKDSGARPDEIERNGGMIVRGQLEGARDWDKPSASDRAAGGPMNVLWFGGPDTSQTQFFRETQNFAVVASGRYFMLSESRLTSVDAYNGTVQWSRMIPRKHRDLREIDEVVYTVSENGRPRSEEPAVDAPDVPKEPKARDKHAVDDAEMVPMQEAAPTGSGRSVRVAGSDRAFLVLGQGQDETWIEFDSRSGDQRRIYRDWTPPPSISLRTPQKWSLQADAARSGVVALESNSDGLLLTLTRKEPACNKLDTWDLYFDFRPLAKRCGLYEPGTFHFVVTPAITAGTPPAVSTGSGAVHPRVVVGGERTQTGSRTTLTIPWSEVEKITRTRPASFGFAATMNSHEGARGDAASRRHLFGDWAAEAINNGWANVFVGDAPTKVDPPEIVAPLTAELRKKYPDRSRNRDLQPMLDDPAALGSRVHPLTGDIEPKIYRPGTGGCGGPYYSSTSRFGRATGMLGLYDFIDDSGLRNLSGIKAGCSTAMTPALGLLIISPEGGHCVCTFPFATTVTLAPADRRLNEDWAIYHDRPADTIVRHAAINLGAFGDRRDDHGTLWLGFPRPAPDRALNFSFAAGTIRRVAEGGIWMRFQPAAMQVPLVIEYLDPARSQRADEDLKSFGYWAWWSANRLNREFGPYRVNTDTVRIAGTDRPWIYGNGYRGLKSATLQLDFRSALVARGIEGAAVPAIDGKFTDIAWGDKPDTTLKYTRTQVYLRCDRENLYVAMKRPTFFNRMGEIAAWAATTRGEDASVWDDDSSEVFLSDSTSGRVLHLGVSASGARYDALVADPAQAKEDRQWNGPWTSAAIADQTGLCVEMAIPLKTIASAGLKIDSLAINVQMNQRDTTGEAFLFPGGQGLDPKQRTRGEALAYLGPDGREHCRNFTPLGLAAPPPTTPRTYTVRLHFAELDGAKPGQRVFDVKLQSRVVLKDLDIAKEAGQNTAMVREFKLVPATNTMAVEFYTHSQTIDITNAPTLSALEIVEDGFQTPKSPAQLAP